MMMTTEKLKDEQTKKKTTKTTKTTKTRTTRTTRTKKTKKTKKKMKKKNLEWYYFVVVLRSLDLIREGMLCLVPPT